MKLILRVLSVVSIFLLSTISIQVMAQETEENEKDEIQKLVRENFNLSIGLGVPEIISIGFCYQHDQLQLGLFIGSMPWLDRSEEAVRTITGDLRYHFGGSSDFSKRHPWYFQFGITYFRSQRAGRSNRPYYEEYLYGLTTRVGRDFNLTNKYGIALELGPIWCLSEKYFSYRNNFTKKGCRDVIIPGFRIGFFYRYF